MIYQHSKIWIENCADNDRSKSNPMNDETQNTEREHLPEQISFEYQPDQSQASDGDSIELGLRFLVGLLASGGDEVAHRLQKMQAKLNQDPTLWRAETPAEYQSLRRQAWYLGVGLIQRGQKRLRRDLRRVFERSSPFCCLPSEST